jgi:gliding motility-associated-like protein
MSKKGELAHKLESQFQGSNAQFEFNSGQYDGDFDFRFTSPAACVDFHEDKIVFRLRKVKRDFNPERMDEHMLFDYVSWQIDLNASSMIEWEGELQKSIVNYFLGSDKKISKQSTKSIIYRDIYPNIDLVFYKSKEGQLKYDFLLHPTAKLSDIKLDYSGVENMSLDSVGNLVYQTEWGIIKEEVPYSYRKKGKQEVAIDYVVSDKSLSFSADFDEVTEEIVLDPIYVDWSSYFFGTGNNGLTWSFTWVFDLDIDADDNVYVAGITTDRFPGMENAYDSSFNGSYDAYVCKMSPSGDSILWFTYLGGSSWEYYCKIAVNDAQEPVITGFSNSSDFPTTAGVFDNTINNGGGGSGWFYSGFVTKFTSDGDSLLFSGFLGGNGSDLTQSIVIDEDDYIYLAGQTSSSDFPTTAGCYQSTYGGGTSTGGYWNRGDAFLTKMEPDGSDLVFSTYFGGINDDVAYQVDISPNKDIYIVGKTSSTNFPTTEGSTIFNYNVVGSYDGFIAKFDPSGNSLEYSKMMGGSGEDWFEGVYVNERDEAYVAGISNSSNFYTTNGAYQTSHGGGYDAVVVKFNPGGQNVYYSTYLGGSGEEYYPYWFNSSNVRIAANVREEPIICGVSRSSNFPVTSDALFPTNPSASGSSWYNTSATIVKLDFLGRDLLYGTYYGGSNFELPGVNKLKRISCYTNILYGGFTTSTDYPTTTGVYRESRTSTSSSFYWTGFISKFRDTLYTDEISLNISDTIIECNNVFEILDAKNIGADILWSTGSSNRIQIVEDTGTYWVQASYGCDTARDTLHIIREFSPIVPILPADSTYCDIFPTINLDAQNDTILRSYTWSTADSVQAINISEEGAYWVDIETPHCGTKRDSVVYTFRKTPVATLPIDSTFCDDISILLQVGDSAANEETFVWSTGDSTSYLNVDSTRDIQVKITNYCGIDSARMNIDKIESPEFTLPLDSQFCNTVNLWVHYGKANNEEKYLFRDIDANASVYILTDSFLFSTEGHFEGSIANKCATAKDSILITQIVTPEIDLGNDSIFCDNMNYPISIGTSDNDEIFLWENTASTDNRTLVNEGQYWAEVSNKCGTVRDTINLQIIESPTVDLPADSVFCDNVNINLDVDITEPSTYVWSTGDNDSAINVNAVGLYKVTISNHCGSVSDSMLISMLTSPAVNLGDDEIFCGGITPKDYTVGKELNDETYLWSNGEVLNSTSFLSIGTHWVRITNKCAEASDSIDFSVSPNPIVDLGIDTTLCGNFSLTLDAGNPGMEYQWEPYGETTQTIQANEQLVYRVTVYNENGCEGSDDFEVRPDCISSSFIPTAFSPNDDGLNDVFKPTLINFEDYTLQIYNRWGQKIFESSDASIGWDGQFNGKTVQNGVYTYVMRYKTTEDNQWENVGGVVNVIR